MYQFYLVLLAYSFFRGVRGCIRTVSSYLYIKSDKSNGNCKHNTDSIKFHILIPVLREQDIVENTIEHFLSLTGNYYLYLVTTEKELFEKENSIRIPNKYKTLRLTKEIIEKYIQNNPQKASKLKIIHYPNTVGVMAHQLNYALQKLSSRAKNNDFVLIYNADSRVKPDILEKYADIIRNENKCQVILQSSLFMANFHKLSGFLKSIALLQTRWSLAHEIPRVLRTNGIFGFTEVAHVVGHGLCVKYSFIRKIGGFPQDYLNEDLPLGYFIRLSGARIHLLRELENADTPTSVKNMFNMYRTWFYGVLFYPSYIKKALVNPKFNKILALVWGLKYSIRGILWVGLSVAWLLLFGLPIIFGKPMWLIASLISFFIYAPLNFWLIYRSVGKDFGIHFELSPILWSPVTYLTHSYGPWLAAFDYTKSKLFKFDIYKHKTER